MNNYRISGDVVMPLDKRRDIVKVLDSWFDLDLIENKADYRNIHFEGWFDGDPDIDKNDFYQNVKVAGAEAIYIEFYKRLPIIYKFNERDNKNGVW